MKTFFIDSKSKLKISNSELVLILKSLPKEILITYSIQYKDIANQIYTLLSKKNSIAHPVQVLGCSKLKLSKTIKAILLIGSGRFHASSLALETKLPIYILENKKITKISEKEISNLEKKQKANYVGFLNAENIGILISTKPGQENLKKAIEFKKKCKNKKSYLFLGNNLSVSEFENFGLDFYVNTSCPRLDMDSSKIINLSRL